ncbi:MAG: phage tail protein [Selenomonadaceae bacterium]|nr:phage tail protein [Selenomonadaceae bacterium]
MNNEDIYSQIRGQIGSFGTVSFTVSASKVLTFDDWKRKTSARFAKHDLINRQPILEYLGADLNEISFKIKLVADLGVNPKDEADKLREMCTTGQAEYLTVGGEVIGQFVIDSIDESAEFWARGELLVSELNVRFKEYVSEL